MKIMKKKTGIIVGIACAVLAVAVLIGSMGAPSAASESAYRFNGAGLGGMFSNWSNLALSNSLNYSQNAESQMRDDRIVIGSASVYLQTRMYDACTAAIKAKLAELEGYCDASSEENYQSGREARIVARVPGKKLDAFLDSLTEHAAITSKNVNFSDVTDSLIDTESKKKSLEAERDALIKLIDQANNVDEVMRVQQRLSEVRGELESYLKKLQELKNQTEYSTVELYVSEVDRISTPSQKFSALAGSGFLSSIKNIGAGFRNFALWLIAAVPYLVLLSVPGVVVAVLLKRAMKKRNAKKAAKEA